MSTNDLFTRPIGSLTKSAMTTRVDVALKQEADEAKQWRLVCRQVDARDGRACRCCDKATDPDARGLLRGHRHHIVYRSARGPDETWNVCTLCPQCHDQEHVKRTLRVEGNADQKLAFWRPDAAGVWFIVREEIAVRVVRRD